VLTDFGILEYGTYLMIFDAHLHIYLAVLIPKVPLVSNISLHILEEMTLGHDAKGF